MIKLNIELEACSKAKLSKGNQNKLKIGMKAHALLIFSYKNNIVK